jgi:UDP-N-acetylmuramoylalanine--D-glutamate ligase
VFLPGTGTDRLLKDNDFKKIDPIIVDNLEDAVHQARVYSCPGDIVLMSPAFASFGLFKNEFDRGDQFNKICKNL